MDDNSNTKSSSSTGNIVLGLIVLFVLTYLSIIIYRYIVAPAKSAEQKAADTNLAQALNDKAYAVAKTAQAVKEKEDADAKTAKAVKEKEDANAKIAQAVKEKEDAENILAEANIAKAAADAKSAQDAADKAAKNIKDAETAKVAKDLQDASDKAAANAKAVVDSYIKYENIGFFGDDITEFKSTKTGMDKLKEAIDLCEKTPNCVGFTYSKSANTYYLKRNIGLSSKPEYSTNVVSNFKVPVNNYVMYENTHHFGNDIKTFSPTKQGAEGLQEAIKECMNTKDCAGFAYNKRDKKYFLKKQFDTNFVPKYDTNIDGYFKDSINNYRIISNTDYPGNDIQRYEPPNKTREEIQKKCDETPTCQAYNFEKNRKYGYLKTNVTGQKATQNNAVDYYLKQGLIK